MSFPALRSRLVLALWHDQQRGSRRVGVIVFGPKPVATVDALDPVELGRSSELQRDEDV